jgi:hypothetical protein
MKTTCPACGAVNSLDSIIGHDAARSLIIQAMEQAPVGRRLVRYIGLFRPAKRNLSWDRLYALLGELLAMIKAGKVERHGRLWSAPETVWIAALDEILARRDEGKLTLPLKSHGYLLEIIAGQANKAEAAAETRKEWGARGVTQTGAHASHSDFKPEKKAERSSPETARAALEKVKKTIKQPANQGA